MTTTQAATTTASAARTTVAANVRARMAWMGMTQADLTACFGWSRRTIHNKLHAETGFTDAELWNLAELFGLDDPGPLFRVPETFPVRKSDDGLLTCTFNVLPQVRAHVGGHADRPVNESLVADCPQAA